MNGDRPGDDGTYIRDTSRLTEHIVTHHSALTVSSWNKNCLLCVCVCVEMI